MTRKEELKQRAITIVDEFPVCFETEIEKKEYQEYVFDMLLNVERDHDAEQRQVIEQLRKELDLLKADDAERCTLIRDMEEERKKDAEIEQLKVRLYLVWKDFTANMAYQGQLEKRNADLMWQIATLREALEFIATQNKPGNWAVESAKQALKEVNL